MVHENPEQYIAWGLPSAEKSVQVMQEIEKKRGRRQVFIQVPTLGVFYPPFSEGLKRKLGVVEVGADEITAGRGQAATKLGGGRMLLKHKFSKSYAPPEADVRFVESVCEFSAGHSMDIVIIDSSAKNVSDAQFYAGKIIQKTLGAPVELYAENGFTLPADISKAGPMVFLLNPALVKRDGRDRRLRASIDDRNLLTQERNVLVFDDFGGITTLHRLFFQKFADRLEERMK